MTELTFRFYEEMARRVAETDGNIPLVTKILGKYVDFSTVSTGTSLSIEGRKKVEEAYIELVGIANETTKRKILESLEKSHSKLEFLLALAAHNSHNQRQGGRQ